MSVKNVVAITFMCLIIKVFHSQYLPKLIILWDIKMAVLSKIKSLPKTVDYFKELPFYNKSIKKPKIKRLKNIDQLA